MIGILIIVFGREQYIAETNIKKTEIVCIMNTNNFSSWEAQYDTPDIVKNYNEQIKREEFIKKTKKRELFQETFPTENYDNLERFYSMGKGIIANDGCHEYIDKTTLNVYSWNFCFNHWKLKNTSDNAPVNLFIGKQPTTTATSL